jgi:hypothetical protein
LLWKFQKRCGKTSLLLHAEIHTNSSLSNLVLHHLKHTILSVSFPLGSVAYYPLLTLRNKIALRGPLVNDLVAVGTEATYTSRVGV